METIINSLRNPKVLVFLMIIAVPMILFSKWIVPYANLMLMDGISDPEGARILLSHMTSEQITGHLWFTNTLDLILPFAAASLFASAAMNAFGKFGWILALPPLAALPLDLVEGVVQTLALINTADLLDIKAYTTPVKSMGYKLGFLISLVALIKWMIMKIMKFIQPKAS